MEPWLKDHCDKQLAVHDIVSGGILSVIDSRLHFRPTGADAAYADRLFIVSTTGGDGYCGCPHPEAIFDAADFPEAGTIPETVHSCIQIALADASLGAIQCEPSSRTQLIGTIEEKAQKRAEIVRQEIVKLLGNRKESRAAQVGMVGVVGSIIHELRQAGMQVSATEFDDTLIGQNISGVTVTSGEMTPQMIKDSDVALITGMTIATETLGPVLAAAEEGDTPLVFFAQTGVNILRTLTFPVPTAIVAEKFPHYMWPGTTDIELY